MISGQLIAHRGWQSRYPENTLPALKEALAVGAKHVEIDIQLTSDHIPIVCHDHILNRLCGQDKDINHCRFKELVGFSSYEPERLGNQFLGTPLSTLEDCVELFQQHPESTFYVELKRQSIRSFGADAMLDAVLPLLEKIAKQCMLISFDLDILCRASQRGWKNIAPVLTDLQEMEQSTFQELSPPLVFCDHDLLEDTENLSQLPFPIAIYEIDNYSLAHKLIEQGAALIETFSIGELIAEDKNNTAN